jgi:thiol-disulfide isomerase/thioredoxin
MKKIPIIIVLALLCLNFRNVEDTKVPIIKPFRVGEKLPESFWKQQHNFYEKGRLISGTLEPYKDKLLILDFWATWCGSCIHKFSLSDSLQTVYKSQLAVVLINAKTSGDEPEGIGRVMGRFGNRLSTIVSDTLLSKQFPHTVIPHYVWIEGGQLRSVTGSELMTEQSILSSFDRRKRIDTKIKNLLNN